MKYKKSLGWVLVILLSFSVGFITNVSDNYFEISKNLDIFGKLYREVNALYVEDTDPSELMRVGIDAMLNSLDPYTNYISENEVEDFRFMSTGQYAGIGASIGKRGNKILVIEPYAGYPADQAGLKAGDQIMAVDGKAVNASELEVVDVRNLLRGEKGTSIRISVNREGEEGLLDIMIQRDRIKIKNVPYAGMIDEAVGYIALKGFTQDASKEVEEAIQTLKRENPKLSGIILDLRDNPGGRLDEAVNVANVFIPQKEKIVETRGRIEGSQRIHYAQRIPVSVDMPLAVLVNGRSASASEIVAGAIQDLDRGIIVGKRSFGKGLVQNIRPLTYNTQLKVTTAKYYTPSGRCIQAVDYGDRDENGNVSRIPDSLKSSFLTRNGRPVFDGGGIEPDIKVKEADMPTIIQELNRQGFIFDFATLYARNHSSIGEPRSFKITDAIYNEFATYVKSRNFDYQTDSDRQLDKLKEVVEEEAYYAKLSGQLEVLEDQLEQQKDKNLYKRKDVISRLLRFEIAKRYYYRQGLIEAGFRDDPEILAAVSSLSDLEQYKKMLNIPR